MRKIFIFLLLLGFVSFLGLSKANAQVASEIPVYEGSSACSEGSFLVDVVLDDVDITATLFSIPATQATPTVITLPHPGEYMFEADGWYNYDAVRMADAGYATDFSGLWSSLDHSLGIFDGAAKRGVTSLVSDMGTGEIGIVEWGDFDLAEGEEIQRHDYNFVYDVESTSVQFAISDWWDSWYANACNNQSCMTDNSGALFVRVYECVAREAEITNPATDGEVVSGDVTLEAYLVDDDFDNVQWAVRKGTCAAGTGTVMGNVDGFHDTFDWIHDGYLTYNFSKTFNVDSWEEGKYCFVFNPTEDAGEPNIRLTREFVVENDNDNDGVLDEADFCDYSVDDATSAGLVTGFMDLMYNPYYKEWGQNRWLYTELGWAQKVTKKKSTTYNVDAEKYTMGCTCRDMLTELNALGDFVGHWKYGCSSSILEHFNEDASDGVIDGYNFNRHLESLNVYAKENGLSSLPVSTIDPLKLGKKYVLRSSGTANAGDTIEFDAMCSVTSRIPGDTWTDLVSGYHSYGTELLDLYVGTENVDWGDCNADHVYKYEVMGDGYPLSFYINDIYPSNNSGFLTVDIFGYLY